MVSVVETIFLLLISVASRRQYRAHNYSNISTSFNVGALGALQVSRKGPLQAGPSQHLCSSSSHTSVCTSTPASSTPTQRLNCATMRSERRCSPKPSSPRTSDTASDTSGPSAGVNLPTQPLLRHSTPTRKPTFTARPDWPCLFAPPLQGDMKTKRRRYLKFSSA